MAFLQMRSETGEGMGSRVCGDGTGGGLAEKRACFGVRADAVRLVGPPSPHFSQPGVRWGRFGWIAPPGS